VLLSEKSSDGIATSVDPLAPVRCAHAAPGVAHLVI